MYNGIAGFYFPLWGSILHSQLDLSLHNFQLPLPFPLDVTNPGTATATVDVKTHRKQMYRQEFLVSSSDLQIKITVIRWKVYLFKGQHCRKNWGPENETVYNHCGSFTSWWSKGLHQDWGTIVWHTVQAQMKRLTLLPFTSPPIIKILH